MDQSKDTTFHQNWKHFPNQIGENCKESYILPGIWDNPFPFVNWPDLCIVRQTPSGMN